MTDGEFRNTTKVEGMKKLKDDFNLECDITAFRVGKTYRSEDGWLTSTFMFKIRGSHWMIGIYSDGYGAYTDYRSYVEEYEERDCMELSDILRQIKEKELLPPDDED